MDSRKLNILATYRYYGRRERWLIGIIGPVVLIVQAMFVIYVWTQVLYPVGDLFSPIIPVLMLILIANVIRRLIFGAFINRVIFWENGIETFIFGIQTFARWDDLQQFGYNKRRSVWGIYTRQIERQEMRFFARLFNRSDSNFIPLGQLRIFRLRQINQKAADRKALQKSQLYQDLLIFAPHIIDDDEKVKHNG